MRSLRDSTLESGTIVRRGTFIGRYVTLGCVGRGAMGEVYAAYDPELDRKLAIKLLRVKREPGERREASPTGASGGAGGTERAERANVPRSN